jgi:hypothetical protein
LGEGSEQQHHEHNSGDRSGVDRAPYLSTASWPVVARSEQRMVSNDLSAGRHQNRMSAMIVALVAATAKSLRAPSVERRGSWILDLHAPYDPRGTRTLSAARTDI